MKIPVVGSFYTHNVAPFAYQTGMSIADSATQVAAMGSAATLFMGASAAANQAKSVIQRGGTNRQAFWGGLASGAAEAIFEYVSIDKLLSPKNVGSIKDLLRETVKQAGVEASEEMFTEVANILSDAAMDLYGEKGLSITYEGALNEAAADYAGRMLEDGKLLDDFIQRNRDNRTLLEKLRDAFRAIIDKLTGREKQQAQSAEARLTAALEAGAKQAGELNRQGQTQGTETAATMGSGEYAIKYDQNNRPFVEVEEDILTGVPKEKWIDTVKETLSERFPDGVRIGNSTIKINSQTRREMTFSEYTKWLARNDKSVYADKFRAAGYADEIILASREYINEGLKHARKDNIKDFARGTVLLRIGGVDYSAEVVVGTTSSGEMLLYDIVNMQKTAIKEKDSRYTVQPNQAEGRRSGAPATGDSIRQANKKATGNFP